MNYVQGDDGDTISTTVCTVEHVRPLIVVYALTPVH